MFNFILVAGIIWLLLTVFEPLVAYFEAKSECDRKYAPARARRAEIYEELAAMHRQSPLYQQMVQQKNVKNTGARQQRNNRMNGRTQKSKRAAGVISAASNGMGSAPQGSHPCGRIVQHRK